VRGVPQTRIFPQKSRSAQRALWNEEGVMGNKGGPIGLKSRVQWISLTRTSYGKENKNNEGKGPEFSVGGNRWSVGVDWT